MNKQDMPLLNERIINSTKRDKLLDILLTTIKNIIQNYERAQTQTQSRSQSQINTETKIKTETPTPTPTPTSNTNTATVGNCKQTLTIEQSQKTSSTSVNEQSNNIYNGNNKTNSVSINNEKSETVFNAQNVEKMNSNIGRSVRLDHVDSVIDDQDIESSSGSLSTFDSVKVRDQSCMSRLGEKATALGYFKLVFKVQNKFLVSCAEYLLCFWIMTTE